jgi:DNA replication and repair protein RecF
MIIRNLKIHYLRSFKYLDINLNPDVNFIVGLNGSGKTTFLEAIYLLSTGHSFKTRDVSPLITYDFNQLTIHARFTSDNTISISKQYKKPTLAKINHQPCSSAAELSKKMPVLLYYPTSFETIDAGPSARREMMNWGMFHVKHEFHPLWKQYKRALKQRNLALLNSKTRQDMLAWDKPLVEIAESLHLIREEYFKLWLEVFEYEQNKIGIANITLDYEKGWDRKKQYRNYISVLDANYEQDKYKKNTQYGPHQADIIIHQDNKKAKQHLSRGQQKVLILILKCSQTKMMPENCIYLFDDVKAELDQYNYEKIIEYIIELSGQKIITSLEKKEIEMYENKSTFHILEKENRLSTPASV